MTDRKLTQYYSKMTGMYNHFQCIHTKNILNLKKCHHTTNCVLSITTKKSSTILDYVWQYNKDIDNSYNKPGTIIKWIKVEQYTFLSCNCLSNSRHYAMSIEVNAIKHIQHTCKWCKWKISFFLLPLSFTSQILYIVLSALDKERVRTLYR